MKILESEEFQKEFNKLSKKYKSLERDFLILKSVILVEPKGDGTKHWNILKKSDEKIVFKIRLKCKSTRGSNFRVIYFYNGEDVELFFIEIYFKGQKDSEEKNRINEFWKSKNL